MDEKKIGILERALARERAARKQAEAILEKKSADLFGLTQQLKDSNTKLEELLNEKTSQLRGVFENIIDAYVVMDLKGDVLKMNDAAVDLFGANSNDESTNVVDLIYRQDLGYAMLSYNELIEKGHFTNYKARIYTKQKKIKWVHINASLIHDEQGKPLAAQGIVRDITEAQLNDEIIEEQQLKLSAIVDHSSLGIILTQEGNIIQTNKAAQSLLLYSNEELLKLHVKDISYIEDRTLSADLMLKMNSNELDHFVIKKRYNRKDGTEVWARTNVAAVRNEDGSIRYQVALIEDVTEQQKNELERKKLLDSLEAQKQKYSNIIANMNLGLVEVDNNDRVLLVNQSFEEMSGYSEAELLHKEAKQILLKDEFHATLENENIERKKGKSNSYEVVAKTKDGTKKHWLISGAPNYDLNGEIIGSIGIHLDITELKSLEIQKESLLNRLEKSNDELQEYAHIVSHDLKSPLRSIYALVDWIKEDNKEVFNKETTQNISLIESTLEKMEQLITDVLEYSSVTSEESVSEAVDLNKVIEDIHQILFFPEHIELSLKKKLPIINADRVRIQQLFQNLIGNAIRYIDKDKGLIEIDVEDKNTYFLFSVTDNGIGIEKKFHEKIFKIFQSLKKSKESSGIGLSIVKKIVDLYDGKIWVESVVGEGTTFYFTLKK